METSRLAKCRKMGFSKEQVYSFGIQLINILEKIHRAGFVYNDLKLDNLLLDPDINEEYLFTTEDNIFETVNINIIDFGFATPYLD